MKSLIISGGYLDDEFAEKYIEQGQWDVTIGVDSGMSFFYRTKQVPDYIVGDFDSVEPEILESFLSHQSEEGQKKPKILQFQPEKDETDTEIAIRTAVSQGCRTIHILGGTGSRLDHVMGNIHLLGMGMEQGASVILADRNNRIRMMPAGELVIKKEEQYGRYVSLLPFTPQVEGLTLTGFKYPLEHAVMQCYHSLGLSNEIVEEEAGISFQEGVLLVMESID